MKRSIESLVISFVVVFTFGFINAAFASDITISQNAVWQTGSYTYDNVLVTNGATLAFNGMVTLHAQNLTVDTGASISASGKGYAGGYSTGSGQGPGGGGYKGGGGYGGKGGGTSGGASYGSSLNPADLGSGGGGGYYYYATYGGNGGGAIKLLVSNTLTINGSVTANGGNGAESSGGGSGGSIYISANTMQGSGKITADGGSGNRYGVNNTLGPCGGGGRVTVYYQTSTFNGNAEAKCGSAGAGNDEDGTVAFFDTLNNIVYPGHAFRFQENDGSFNFSGIILNNSKVTTRGSISLTANELTAGSGSNFSLGGTATAVSINKAILSGSSSIALNDSSGVTVKDSLLISASSSFTFTGSQSLVVPSIALSGSSFLTLSGKETLSVNNITLTGNSAINHAPQGKIYLNLVNLALDAGSSISANEKGYAGGYYPNSGQGPGAGGQSSGGGYGGKGGGASGGSPYGSSLTPADLGSGGGGGYWYYSTYGGNGGGAIELVISNMLTINGSITAKGGNGVDVSGGGSGGSIYIFANAIGGSGQIASNGGSGAHYGVNNASVGPSGGGGRVAVYYKTSVFTGTTEAKGGIGGPGRSGEDGTVVINGLVSDFPVTFFNLTEKSSTVSTTTESLSAQAADLNNVAVSGDLNGVLGFTGLEIVKITSGSFSGGGFSEGQFTAILEGVSYSGSWNGAVYFSAADNRVYLKGSLSGDLNGIAEGILSESAPGSGVYDKYEAVWKLNRVGVNTASADINLAGALSYHPQYSFNSSLRLSQLSMDGNASGYYTGPLSAVITYLRVTGDNDYKDKGFSVISYNSLLDDGEGRACNRFITSAAVESQGLFKDPIEGKLSCVLNESVSPKTLSGQIERLDAGLAPAPDLKVRISTPKRMSPGQTVTNIIEIRNDGLQEAKDAELLAEMPLELTYISSTGNGVFTQADHGVRWHLGDIVPKTVRYVSYTAQAAWGLASGLEMENTAIAYAPGIKITVDEASRITYEFTEASEGHFKFNALLSNQAASGVISVEMNFWDIPEEIPPQIEYTETADASQLTTDVTVIGSLLNNRDVMLVPLQYIDTARNVINTSSDMMDYNRACTEYKMFYEWLEDTNRISAEDKQNLTKSTETMFWIRSFIDFFCTFAGATTEPPLSWLTIPYSNYLGQFIDKSMPGVNTIVGAAICKSKTGSLPDGWRTSFPAVWQMKNYYKEARWIYNDTSYWTPEGYRNSVANMQKTQISTARDPNELLVSPQGEVKPDDKLTYTINYENEGEGNAYGVYVTDSLPQNLNDATLVINNGGKHDPVTHTIAWFIGELPSKQKGSVSFSVNVRQDAADKTEVINFATVYFPSVPEATRTNGTVNIVTTSIDNVAAATAIQVSTPANQAGWNNTDVVINLSATDNDGGAGVKELHYQLTGASSESKTISGSSAQVTISSEGTTALSYYSVDNAGNTEMAKSHEFKIDKTPPVIITNTAPEANANGWNNSDVTVSFTATDSLSGVAGVTEPTIVTSEGKEQHIGGEAVDLAGNRAAAYVVVNLDKTLPNVNITATPNLLWPPNHKMAPVLIGGKAADSLSGVSFTSFQVNDEYGKIHPAINAFNSIVQLEAWRNGEDMDGRIYTISVTVKDKAGNTSSKLTTVICPHDQRK